MKRERESRTVGSTPERRGVRILLRPLHGRERSNRNQIAPKGQDGPIGEVLVNEDGIGDDERSGEPDLTG